MTFGNQASGPGRDKDARHLEQQLARAVQALRTGQPTAAATLAASLVQAWPTHPHPLYVLAQAYMQAGDKARLRSIAGPIAGADGRVPPALRAIVAAALADVPDPAMIVAAAALQSGDAMAALAAVRRAPGRTATSRLFLALALWIAGRGPAADGAARQAIALEPATATGWLLLGAVQRSLGRADMAATGRAWRLSPHDPMGGLAFSAALLQAGRPAAAAGVARIGLMAAPGLPALWLNLAVARAGLGDLHGAADAYARLLSIAPRAPQAVDRVAALLAAGRADAALEAAKAACAQPALLPGALPLLALALAESGRAEAAVGAARRAVAIAPDRPLAWLALSRALRGTGDLEAAAQAARRLLCLAPGDRDGLVALGVALDGIGRTEAARRCFAAALALTPAHVTILSNLGAAYAADRAAEPALRWLRRAVRVDSTNTEAANNLALALKLAGRVGEAERIVQGALALAPGDARSWSHLGALRLAAADASRAAAAYRRATRSAPEDQRLHGNLLLCLNYDPDVEESQLAAEHRRTPAARLPMRTILRRGPEPVRIGFVSPDFRTHPVGWLLRAVLEPLNRLGFRTVGYADIPRPDAVTADLRRRFGQWRDVTGLSDAALARRIAEDGIDILIDLAGHTAGNRLSLFARRAAAVQATWIGYSHTTGIPAMDWVLTDADTDPPGTEGRYTERLLRLPRGRFCYGPPDDAPEPGPLPMLTAGAPTFGSFNNLAKLNDRVAVLWASLMRACPGARLLLIWESLDDPGVAAAVRSRFAAAGLDASRLELRGYGGHAALLRAYGEVDVGLDPFPFCGGLSTLESLWMGVPVVSLASSRPVGRQGVQMLRAIGRPEWAAESPDGYVAAARALVADPGRLAAERAGLRARVAASPLTDAEGMAAQLADAFRLMWRAEA